VFFLCIDWDQLISFTRKKDISFNPIVKFPQVTRDLSLVIDRKISYQEVEKLVKSLHLSRLDAIRLFDVFENDKIGKDKKSFAISFTFSDKEKTLTDGEIEDMMNKIISLFESQLNAVIRSNA
jgi:phenylalanyl-tRNA synthetase beta chain